MDSLIIPYKRFVIETTLTVDEAVQMLSRVVQPRKFWSNPFSGNRRQFEGTVSKESFKFVRNIYYANSFLPTIKGTFESADGVTRIIVTLAGNPCVAVSMTAVFAFFGYVLTSVLMGLISSLFVGSGSLALGAIGYLIYTSAFKLVSNTDQDFMVKLFSQAHKK